MKMVKTLMLVFFASLLLFFPKMEAQLNAPPLCASQYALVNYACAFAHKPSSFDDHVYLLDQGDGLEEGNGHGWNYTQVPNRVQRSDDEHRHRHDRNPRNEHEGGHNHRHEHEGGHKHRHEHERGHNHRHGHEGGRNHRRHGSRHERGRGHRHRNEDENEHGHGSRHEHGRGHRDRHEDDDEHENGSRHRHRHRRHGHHKLRNEECCRWLTELDDVCVCYLLLRLPPFLSSQEHEYTISLRDSCQVTYTCPGRTRL